MMPIVTAHRDLSNTFAGSQTERFADVITIVDKGLWKQIRETLPQKAFAFRSGIDNQMRAAQCFCHLYFFVDGLHQCFCRKGTHDAGSAENGDAPHDAQFRVKSFDRQFLSSCSRPDLRPHAAGVSRFQQSSCGAVQD